MNIKTNKSSMTRNRFIGCAVLMGASGARAQGLISASQNLTSLFGTVTTALIALGVLAGLGFMLKGLMDLASKTARGNDDITWGSIASKIGGGGLAMALGWLGVQVVETLGGSGGDIGRGI